ncbi:MAG: hypothetical protein R3E91_04955 [Chlamydiales bacterium]
MFRKFLEPGPKYHWKKVLLFLTIFTSVISGGTTGVYLVYQRISHMHTMDLKIEAIVQTGTHYAPLQTAYLSEVLELSCDQLSNFNQFDLQEGYERLMATHLIRKLSIKKIQPNILYIDYEVRQPIAYLEDYTNTAIDEEGKLFPYLPFYLPYRYPKIYLGAQAPPNPWGKQLDHQTVAFISGIFNRLHPLSMTRIDLSQVNALSAGNQQIIIVLKNGSILRLTPKNYAEELRYYDIMIKEIQIDKKCVIDFRNPEVAYISYEK